MLWALGSAVGLVVMTGIILILARPVTARWERESDSTLTRDE